jgi:translation initiation factor 2B subunit (eIF-2B alpha/beta/delta family)
MFELFEHVY